VCRGWYVFATMRDLEKRGGLERALDKSGVRDSVEIVALNLNDPATIDAAVESIFARTGGRLDAVVHNAGVSVAGAVEDLPVTEMRRVMETNFFGVIELTRAVLPAFRAARQGRIVMISSEAAFIGQPANSIYCASKWALEGWAESLAYEVEPFGIKVILVEPGPYRTQIWHSTPRIQPPDSAYLAWATRVFQAADMHAARSARDPREVALVIADALEAKHPRFRYPVGPFARLNHFLRGKLPSRLIRRGVSRYLGLMQGRDERT
jgi:NAD(P)-dependent dehydrogenase (short-subunit alcohol dehydrogenase family)